MIVYFSFVLGYLVLGLVWARTQAVRLQIMINDCAARQEKIRRECGPYPTFQQEGRVKACTPWFVLCTPRISGTCTCGCVLAAGITYHALGWPCSVLWRIWVWLLSWASAPVRERRGEAAMLRARADEGEKLLRVSSTLDSAERKILLSAWTDYRELAKKLEI